METGRKEVTTFFYFYTLLTVASLVIDCGVVPPGSSPYPYFVAVQCGLASATCIALMINGFVGFQLYEDGTTLSVWLLRSCSLVMFLISFAVSLLTFKGWAGLGPENTVGLFVVVYLFSALFLTVYVVMQLILVAGTLQDRWPLLHIFFGVLAFVIGQIVLYVFSQTICDQVEHYMDGLFFATLLNLLAVMMVYKVRLKSFIDFKKAFTESSRSTGIRSPRRTLNFQWAKGRTIGRSRSYYQKRIREIRCTETATTRTACTISNQATEDRCTGAIDWTACLCWVAFKSIFSEQALAGSNVFLRSVEV